MCIDDKSCNLQFDVMESFQIIPNPKQDSAFAALKEDGSIIAWGDATGGAMNGVPDW